MHMEEDSVLLFWRACLAGVLLPLLLSACPLHRLKGLQITMLQKENFTVKVLPATMHLTAFQLSGALGLMSWMSTTADLNKESAC